MNKTTWIAVALTILTLAPQGAAAQVTAAQEPPYGPPDALIDLRTADGAHLVKGQWRYRDRKSTRLNSSHIQKSRMPSSA